MHPSSLNHALTLAFLVCSSASISAQMPLLQSPTRGFHTGQQIDTDAYRPQHTACADMDGDGDADLVIAHAGNIEAPKVSVMFNRGDGSYNAPVNYDAPGQTMEVALADFDGDGDPDAAFAQSNDGSAGNRVLVYENTGDGTLLPYVSYTVGTGPTGLIAADVDVDGDFDLISANFFWMQEDVSVLYNNGNGSFPTRVDFPIPGANPMKVAAGDMTGDGAPELVVSLDGGDPAIAVLTNDGFGSFGPAALTSVANASYYKTDVAVADIDLDGDRDVLYGTSGWYNTDTSTGFALFRNTGDGSLGPMESISVGPNFSVIYDFAIADVTGDGWPDVLGTARTSRAGFVLVAGDGAGGFAPAEVYRAGEYSRAVTTDDVDGDGDLDAIVVNHASLTVKVYENNGSGFPMPPIFPLGAYLGETAAGDIDLDGDVDLLASDYERFLVLDNQGDGTFVLDEQPNQMAKAYMKLRDLNGDGFLDAVFAGFGFSRALNDGTGSFGEIVSDPLSSAASDLDTLDMDNDGDLDGVVTGSIFGETGFFTLENDGSGNFGPPTFTGSPDIVPTLRLATGDFTGDGNEDVVTGVWGGIWLWPGGGSGQFGEPIFRDFGDGGVANMTSGDFDGDGILDVAGSNWGFTEAGETLTVVYGNGDGTFSEPVTYFAMFSQWLGGVAGLDSGDVDGDGDLDLFGGCFGADDVALFLNNGDRTFAPQQRFGVDGDVVWVVSGDFNGNGSSGVAANIVDSSFEGGGVTILTSVVAGPWADLGSGLSGSHGLPRLSGAGTLVGGAPVNITLANALENTTAWLVIGTGQWNVPFKGGMWVPSLDIPGMPLPLPTGPEGVLSLETLWPTGLPSAFTTYMQYWIIDPAGPVGFSASNGVAATTP